MTEIVLRITRTPTPSHSRRESGIGTESEYKDTYSNSTEGGSRNKKDSVGPDEQRLILTKWTLLMEAIEKNTQPTKTARLTIVYNVLAIVSLCIAMFFTLTMTYILWIGFYPPRDIQSPFFIDRLRDFRDFLEALRDGRVFQDLTDRMATSLVQSFRQVLNAEGMGVNFTLPPGPLGGR